jgi:hypothetical protein
LQGVVVHHPKTTGDKGSLVLGQPIH